MPRSWYSIQNKADQDSADITIFDAIGSTWDGEGVTAKAFIADLKKIGAKNINLFINSPGGDVMDGIAIHNALAMSGAQITAKIMGMAASAASFVAMAAQRVEMPANTFMMIHNASGFAWGNAETMRDHADLLDKIDSTIAAMYVNRTGKSLDEIKALMSKDTYMTAEEAVNLGFADEVTGAIEATAKFEIETLPETVRAAFKNATKPPVAAPAPAAVVETPLAVQAEAAIEKAGLSEHKAALMLRIENAAGIPLVIERAQNIVAYSAAAGKADKAAALIASNMSVSEVRTELLNALATEDDLTLVDPNIGGGHRPAKNTAAPALSTAGIWAARRKTN